MKFPIHGQGAKQATLPMSFRRFCFYRTVS